MFQCRAQTNAKIVLAIVAPFLKQSPWGQFYGLLKEEQSRTSFAESSLLFNNFFKLTGY